MRLGFPGRKGSDNVRFCDVIEDWNNCCSFIGSSEELLSSSVGTFKEDEVLLASGKQTENRSNPGPDCCTFFSEPLWDILKSEKVDAA